MMRAAFLKNYDAWVAECESLSAKWDGKPMQDPFGMDRGNFRYANIAARLRAIMSSLKEGKHLEGRAPAQ